MIEKSLNFHTFYLQEDWPEGHRLASVIQFHFPECPKVEINAIVTRASPPGLQLLEDFLRWDAERRPTAQQALKYPYFQIVKRLSSTQRLITHNQPHHVPAHIHHQPSTTVVIQNGRMSNMSYGSIDNTIVINQKPINNQNSELMNSENSNTRINMAETVETKFGTENRNALNNSGRNMKDISVSVLNGMFNNLTLNQNGYNNYLNSSVKRTKDVDSDDLFGDLKSVNDTSRTDVSVKEKINDIYVNRNIGPLYGNVSVLSQPKTILMYDGLDNGYSTNYKGFYLHNPVAVHSNSVEKLMNDTKVYNAFSKQRIVAPAIVDHNQSKPEIVMNFSSNFSSATKPTKQTPTKKWLNNDSFEDDELANILG